MRKHPNGNAFPCFPWGGPQVFQEWGGSEEAPEMQQFVPGSTFQEDGAARTPPAQKHGRVFTLLQESLKHPEVTQHEVRTHKA